MIACIRNGHVYELHDLMEIKMCLACRKVEEMV